MTEIDLETGLPHTTQGMFWRVNDSQEYPSFFLLGKTPADWPTGPNVELISIRLIHRFEDRRIFLTPMKRQVYVGHTTEEVVEVREFLKNKDGSYTKRSEMTPKKIRQACERAIEKHEEDLRITKLIGDYPPKKLEK